MDSQEKMDDLLDFLNRVLQGAVNQTGVQVITKIEIDHDFWPFEEKSFYLVGDATVEIKQAEKVD